MINYSKKLFLTVKLRIYEFLKIIKSKEIDYFLNHIDNLNQILITTNLNFLCNENDTISSIEKNTEILENINLYAEKKWKNIKVNNILNLYENKYISIYTNSYLIGKTPIGIDLNRNIILDTIGPSKSRAKKAIEDYIIKSRVNLLNQKNNLNHVTEIIEGEAVLLMSRWNHYAHWLLEHLPKLRAINNSSNILSTGNLNFIVEKQFPQWKKEVLFSFGYSENQLIYWDGKPKKIKKLIVPEYPKPNYSNFLWIKKNMLGDTNITCKKDKKRLYISRSKTSKRRVINEMEIYNVLKKYGFVMIFAEELSPLAQAHLFSEAEIVVGPHGAGFTNTIYSTELKIIEIFSSAMSLFYFQIGMIMGHKYYPFFADSIKNREKKLLNQDMFVNPQKFEKFLIKNNIVVNKKSI